MLKPLNELACRKAHHEAQARSHPIERIKRPEPRGRLVARFFFRLDELLPRNRTRKEKAWQAHQARGVALARIRSQLARDPSVLGGRPQVLCYRYSSNEPDATSGWSKVGVDCLQPGGERKVTCAKRHPFGKRNHTFTKLIKYDGVGLIVGDSPSEAEVIETWEPAPRGDGFCVIDVWSGEDEKTLTAKAV